MAKGWMGKAHGLPLRVSEDYHFIVLRARAGSIFAADFAGK